MWDALTVALVMEFFFGAAILKGMNRASATFLARLARFRSSDEVVLKGDGRTTDDGEAADVSIAIEE